MLGVSRLFRVSLVLTVVAALLGSADGPFAARAAAQTAPPPPGLVADRYIIVLNEDVADPGALSRSLGRLNGLNVTHVYGTALKGFAARLPTGRLADLIARLDRHPRVAFVSPDPTVFATEAVAPGETVPSGIDRTGAENVNGDGVVGPGAPVAVLDTGIIPNHPDLNVVGGHNCTSGNTAAWSDVNGHGTHVAGTIGARNNGSGVVGVAPGTPLYAVKVLGDSGSGTWSSVICGIDWAAANGIRVANLSLGSASSEAANGCASTGKSALYTSICNAVGQGVQFAVSAGNNNQNASTQIPAKYPEVITVSALNDTDRCPGALGPSNSYGADDRKASFSNFGAGVDVAAPGTNVYSTDRGGGFSTKSGTSMAAPHVAGLLALGGYVEEGGTLPEGVAIVPEGNTACPSGGPNPPPTVTLSDVPANVRGTITLTAAASDANGTVSRVAFERASPGQQNWTAIATDANGADGFTHNWNSATVADGLYDVRAVATDNLGAKGASTVQSNRRVDNTAPTVAIAAPANNAVVGGTVDISANPSDGTGSGIAEARFEHRPGTTGTWTALGADGDGADGYAYAWDTTTVAAGVHQLRVIATDAAGNTRTSAVVSVTVDDTAPTVAAGPPGGTYANGQTVTLTATDTTATTIRYTTDGTEPAPDSALYTAPLAIDTAQTTLRFFAVDASSNRSVTVTEEYTITNPGPNPPPIAEDVTATTSEDAAVEFALRGTDAVNCELTFSIVSQPANGTLSPLGNSDCTPGGPNADSATVTYTPNANFAGTTTFTYRVGDGDGGSDTATATITVTNVNDAPVAADDAATTAANTAVTITVLANDVDVDGPALTVTIGQGPANGTATTIGTTVRYTPNLDFSGTDTLTYTVSDGSLSDTATVTITVAPPTNPRPVVTLEPIPDLVRGTITLRATATDANGSVMQMTLQRANAGQNNWATFVTSLSSNGTLTFAWNSATFADGLYDFRATATDDGGAVGTSAVQSNRRLDNTAPAVAIAAPGNNTFVGGTQAVMANPSDGTGSGVAAARFERKLSTEPDTAWTHLGTDSDAAGGYNVAWDTTAGPEGTHNLRVIATDVAGNARTSAVVSVTVDRTAPSVSASPRGGEYATARTVTLTASDATTTTIHYTLDGTEPTSGSALYTGPLTIDAAQTTLKFFAVDAALNRSETVTEVYTITNPGPNVPPIANNVTATTDEEAPVTITLAGSDAVTCDLVFSIVGGPANGSLGATIVDQPCTSGPNADSATVTYTPNANFAGTDTFTYRVSDGDADSAPATATITVTNVNDVPVAADDAATTAANTAVTVNVLANDGDVDGNSLTVTAAGPAGNGAVAINGDGSVTYTPNGHSYTDTFAYTVSDGALGDTATVSITVAPPPPADCGQPVVVGADADAWIDQDAPTVNKGDDSVLKVMSKGPSKNLRGLVHFAPLPTAPQGCVYASATLRLYSASDKPGRVIEAWALSGGWTEFDVNWSNQPGMIGPVATVPTASTKGYLDWDVTEHVGGFYAGANNGFLIKDAVEDEDAEQQLHSKEKGESVPQLVITFVPASASGAGSTTVTAAQVGLDSIASGLVGSADLGGGTKVTEDGWTVAFAPATAGILWLVAPRPARRQAVRLGRRRSARSANGVAVATPTTGRRAAASADHRV